MINSDVRVLLVASYRFESHDYGAARMFLTQKAWAAVRAALALDFYLAVYSFPRWTNIADAMQFGSLQETIDITSDTSACYQLNRSPIDDLITTDAESYFNEEQRSQKLLEFVNHLLNDKDLLFLAVWIGECERLPNVRRLRRDEAVGAIQQSLICGPKDDIAFLID